MLLCDFDGTISDVDVTDLLLHNFGQSGYLKLEKDWEEGKIGSQKCMREQIALLKASQPEVDMCLDQIAIDPYFQQFTSSMKQLNVPVHIVSDGLDYAIERILHNNHLYKLPFFANKLIYQGEQKWQLDFPYMSTGCIKQSGNCKCAYIASLREKYDHIFYVGDGSSDYCVSHKVDMVFAKNKLIDYCQAHAIKHHAIQDFSDIINFFEANKKFEKDIQINCFASV